VFLPALVHRFWKLTLQVITIVNPYGYKLFFNL